METKISDDFVIGYHESKRGAETPVSFATVEPCPSRIRLKPFGSSFIKFRSVENMSACEPRDEMFEMELQETGHVRLLLFQVVQTRP